MYPSREHGSGLGSAGATYVVGSGHEQAKCKHFDATNLGIVVDRAADESNLITMVLANVEHQRGTFPAISSLLRPMLPTH
jgi:hypothetical protein